MKYAVITPYYQEPRATLLRCLGSVSHQTVAADHFLVADGHAQNWIDFRDGTRHLTLDRSHDDVGNTPRALGCLLAAAEDYDAIFLLDADNWLEPSHIEACMSAAATVPDCDYVVARRTIRRQDGTIMNIREEDGHVDTNCMCFLPGSYNVLPYWALIPHELAPGGDRVFYSMLQYRKLKPAWCQRATVNYTCNYASVYQALGEEPPPGAKPNVPVNLVTWLSKLTPRDAARAQRLMGFER